MNKIIKVTKGTGEGLTELSAFDNALQNAGISNYNLIYLSSVIPYGYEPKLEKPAVNESEFGHRLYVVIASQKESRVGYEAWAGIGWVMADGSTGSPQETSKGGLFVEHHGETEDEVKDLITKSLNTMKANRAEKYGEIKHEISGIKCAKEPVCALVAAVYKSENW